MIINNNYTLLTLNNKNLAIQHILNLNNNTLLPKSNTNKLATLTFLVTNNGKVRLINNILWIEIGYGNTLYAKVSDSMSCDKITSNSITLTSFNKTELLILLQKIKKRLNKKNKLKIKLN